MGLALVAVIAVSIVGTVLVLRPDSGGGNGQQNTANSGSEFASANDTGPANIITEDPTCAAWGKISDDVTAASNAAKWNDQDYSVPAEDWSPEQRTAFEKESIVWATAISKVGNLAKQTPHRVMRELYGQFIAYAQAVIDAIPEYKSDDQYIVIATNKFFSAINEVCDAIYFRAAQETAPLIAAPPAPSDISSLTSESLREVGRFLNKPNSTCADWTAMAERFDKDTKAWRAIDTNISAGEWTPEQKAVIDAAIPVMETNADDMERLGRGSGNAVWEDLAVFAAQYRRAYIQAVPTYTPKYSHLTVGATHVSTAIYWACKAAV
ncbi:hypothetical protein [Mycolicibacterium farcinogenes]|uniref:Uncharacterized protein n=1 Tax=Mycolicibacterium farcinogenes TaxID=1802 RepID=A0ACD1FGZ2_MYCFR|nr:hypothetical protein [Mycolicibacterium farcinogenes]QZH66303.1 hypothetical protein K6L26_00830 [Mycolicibacterium farcinogenes]